MLREKIKKKALLFPILTTIIIGFIAAFSNQEIVMNFAFHIDSGEHESGFTLERKASDIIEWDFTSTSDVDLLIIKKSTLEYYERVASDLSSQWGYDYNQLMRDFLENFYISRGNRKDSGKFYVDSSGLHYIKFSTVGTINYVITCDPFSIDLMGIFYILLGVTTTIGIICSIYKFKKLVKMNSNNKKDDSRCENQFKVSCERCGAQCDSDSIFCPECGTKIDKEKRYCSMCGSKISLN